MSFGLCILADLWQQGMFMEYEKATPENFNEIAYLLANPDVGVAVMNGEIAAAYVHLLHFGLKEGRKQFVAKVNQAKLDAVFTGEDVSISSLASHQNMKNLVGQHLSGGSRVLEVGSRCVTSDGPWLREACARAGCDYLGFDYHPGTNVDVVGDAHRLRSLVEGEFDVVYSSAVFEHLAMPWIASHQIAQCLKVGGSVFIETHFSFSSHERPWHFFQFSDMALRVIFPAAMGIECIEAGMSNPIVGRFSALADPQLQYRPVIDLFCHSEFFGRKVRDVPDFEWSRFDLDAVVNHTTYPLASGRST